MSLNDLKESQEFEDVQKIYDNSNEDDDDDNERFNTNERTKR